MISISKNILTRTTLLNKNGLDTYWNDIVAATISRISLNIEEIQRGAKKYHYPVNIACNIKKMAGFIAAIQNERLRYKQKM
jgi:hypothetical protein